MYTILQLFRKPQYVEANENNRIMFQRKPDHKEKMAKFQAPLKILVCQSNDDS
jgi:hypothetical protein